MKSYLQGLITGGVLVFALTVLIGASQNSHSGLIEEIKKQKVRKESDGIGRYIFSYYPEEKKSVIFDTMTGNGFFSISTGPNPDWDNEKRIYHMSISYDDFESSLRRELEKYGEQLK